jgi:hypothetical protein
VGLGWRGLRVVVITRAVAQPSAWTFTIPPIKALLERYVTDGGKGWADPFSGKSTLAEYRNDMDKDAPTPSHLLAEEFVRSLPLGLNGILFDPPYSYRQVTENYRAAGRRAKSIDTSSNFYTRVRLALAPRVKLGGLAICFGWNTTGMGEYLGFELGEVLIVNHRGHHNDTLCTVERKTREVADLPLPVNDGLQRKLSTDGDE